MYSIAERFLIARKWLLSFLRDDWHPVDYPIQIRRQRGAPREASWSARVLTWPGPIGLGESKEQALSSLHADLERIQDYRRQDNMTMPRPGAEVPIEFAKADRVRADPRLLDDFIEHILGFGPSDPVFISDLSTLADFGDDERVSQIRKKILERYGVEIAEPEPVLIADVLERARSTPRD